MSAIAPDEFRIWAQYIQSLTGIVLHESQAYLIEGRLKELLASSGAASLGELYLRVRSDSSGILQTEMIDAITTGESSFFRDQVPFVFFREAILPALVSAASGFQPAPPAFRIWSAGCSTGQETYSIAMVLREAFGDARRHGIRVLGTDISNRAVRRAKQGRFNSIEISRGLTPERLERHFTADGGQWRISEELLSIVDFSVVNLLGDVSHLAVSGKFQVVFCRNVLIYFSERDRARVIAGIASVMEPGGFLVVAAAESVSDPRFEPRIFQEMTYYRFRG